MMRSALLLRSMPLHAAFPLTRGPRSLRGEHPRLFLDGQPRDVVSLAANPEDIHTSRGRRSGSWNCSARKVRSRESTQAPDPTRERHASFPGAPVPRYSGARAGNP